jgi:hypothetical protein
MNEQMNNGNKKCECSHHSVIPALVILLALDFLLGTLGVFSEYTVNVIWPILLIIGAGSKLMSRKCSCC